MELKMFLDQERHKMLHRFKKSVPRKRVRIIPDVPKPKMGKIRKKVAPDMAKSTSKDTTK